MPPNFKVAFIGDHGLGNGPRDVLRMIKDEGADMVLHSGDFDYYDDPDRWDQQINETLGEDFPYFASIGNHDVIAWDGYQKKLQERLTRISEAQCTGDLGVNSYCTYKGLFFVLSGVGTIDSGRASFIKEALASEEARDSLWRICSWHKNQRLMQVGWKWDQVGWEPYEDCREGGAIVATGQEHSYSRTHLMNSFETQSIASESDVLHIDGGKSFAFVSGLTGLDVRGQDDQLTSKPWWAAVYTAAQGSDFGALFCVLNHDGVENQGYCYFQDLNGVIADAFGVIVGPADEIPDASSFVPARTPKREVDYDYTIELPDDRTERVDIEITSTRFPVLRGIDQYFQQAQDNLKEDWEDFWFTPSLFETLSVDKEITDEQAIIRMRYRVREAGYCVLDVVDVVLVSQIVPGSPQVFRIRAWMCEHEVTTRGQLRDDVLNSFEVITKPKPAPYYTQFVSVKGVAVKAHESVDPAALQAGAEIVDAMLSGREDIPGCMARNGGYLAIVPRDQVNTDLPEFVRSKGTTTATGHSYDTFEIRGLGGIVGQPVSSVGEEQIMGNWGPEHPWYPYRGLVAVHEYAHGIQNLCFTPKDWDKWNRFYDKAVEENWYPGSHMMRSVEEFFAVFSTGYFEATFELGDDPNREELRARYPEIIQALDEIYRGATIPEKYRTYIPHPR